MQIKPVTRLRPNDRHELTLLNPRVLQTHAAYKPNRRWSGRFDVAAWVRFPEGLINTVELMIGYRDEERQKSYLVDLCMPNRQRLILLNGTVKLEVTAEVSEMSLYLKGLPDDAVWILDECHLKPKQTAAAVRQDIKQQAKVKKRH